MTTLTLKHSDISQMPTSTISVDYSSGVTLYLKDTSGFTANDYIILDALESPQCEVVQIDSITNSTTVVLSSGGNFPHASDSTITKIPYNQFRVYRSVTGVGGAYSLLWSGVLQVNQTINTYIDSSSQSPYSYQLSYYNSTTAIESSLSDEIPFTGYVDWSLKSMEDIILNIFGDKQEKIINRDMIRYWLNECLRKVQLKITGGDSPYFAASVDIVMDGSGSTELSTYNIIQIFNVQLSRDGGNTFQETVSPVDARLSTNTGGLTQFDYKLIGTTMQFPSPITTGYVLRIWYYTPPVTLTNPTDVLPNPLPVITDLFINWGLRRAHEKDRKFAENALYYKSMTDYEFQSPDSFINKLKVRVKQGNKVQASTWADNYEASFY